MVVAILVLTIMANSQAPRGAGLRAGVGDPVLGFNDCSPVLLRQLPTDELAVSISQIGYDGFGRLSGYRAVIKHLPQ